MKRSSSASVPPPKLTETQRGNKIAASMVDDLAIVCGECWAALGEVDESLPHYVEDHPSENAVVCAAAAAAPADVLAHGAFEVVWARQVDAVREIRRQLDAISHDPAVVAWRRYLTTTQRDRHEQERRVEICIPALPENVCSQCGEEYPSPEDLVVGFKGTERWCATCIQEY